VPYLITGTEKNTGQPIEPVYIEAANDAEARSKAAAQGLVVQSVAFVPVLKLIGYWGADEQPSEYPYPGRLVSPNWRRDDRARIVAYLRSGQLIRAFLGYSSCRICGLLGREMGAAEFTDGEWVWPEGLPHYIEVHSVRLPEELIATMESHGWKVPADLGTLDATLIDESFWKTWGSQV
jgi:hypothetical protein